jgi:hypothetical protein
MSKNAAIIPCWLKLNVASQGGKNDIVGEDLVGRYGMAVRTTLIRGLDLCGLRSGGAMLLFHVQ